MTDHRAVKRFSSHLIAFLLAAGCSGKVQSDVGAAGSSAGGTGGTEGGGGTRAMRTPIQHRVSGSSCPAERGPVTPIPNGCGTIDGGACPNMECREDSDCSAGVNGRCGYDGPLPRANCSYDECASDADCAPSVPCACRDGAASTANFCLTESTCRIDADCGPSGYCSVSRLGQWCGASFHCHTPNDTCLDDSDCAQNDFEHEHCNFDATLGHWLCGGDCGPAPP